MLLHGATMIALENGNEPLGDCVTRYAVNRLRFLFAHALP